MQQDTQPGPVVGLFSGQLPRELFYALGCLPVRVFPSAGKPAAADAYLPRNFCSLNKLWLASFLEDEHSHHLDAVVFADEDDATRRLHDVWRASVSVPVWAFVDVPRLTTPPAVQRYAEVLASVAGEIARRTGGRLDCNSLKAAITLYNEQRSLLAQLKAHWLAGRIQTATYRRLRRLALTQPPLIANERLRQALAEVPQGTGPAAQSVGQSRASGVLLLAELAAPSGLVQLLEARGARLVAEDSDLDERDVADTLDIPGDACSVEDLLLGLAKAYLGKAPGPRMRDLSRRLDYLERLVANRGVRTAICAYSKFCDLYLAEFPVLKAHLESLGVPVLLLELEDEAISGQHRTRVEAFLEMIPGED
jgi:benzoyl-CoA reductase/2-hydroxyglutaryl-CoA dehydratase subunit BcrC/BadD/HgdB